MVVEHLKHITAKVTLFSNGLQFLKFLGIAHETISGIPALGNPSPGSPSPDAEGCREEIAVLTVGRHLVDVKTRNHRDTFIVFIAVEHLLTKGEERLGGHHIVF